jgi:hypothetical protein
MDGRSTIIYQLSHYLFFGKYHTNILLNSLRKLNLFEKTITFICMSQSLNSYTSLIHFKLYAIPKFKPQIFNYSSVKF